MLVHLHDLSKICRFINQLGAHILLICVLVTFRQLYHKFLRLFWCWDIDLGLSLWHESRSRKEVWEKPFHLKLLKVKYYMKFEIGICSCCGQEKKLLSNSNHFEEKYCTECYKNQYGKISCKFCGLQMQYHHYHKHIIDIHSR